MKIKLVLPLVAMLMAIVGAFATPSFVQMGWYDVDGPGGADPHPGNITTPSGDTPVCGESGTSICQIDFFNAYVDGPSASAQGDAGLLRYTASK